MTDKVRIGVIGTGQIGTAHLNRYAQVPQAEVVAVSDPFPASLEEAKQKFGIAVGYADYRELLKRDDIDAVDVCVHNNKHAPITIAAFDAGKNVYCEKPIAGTYHDAESMVKAAKKAGRRLHIQMENVFGPETRAARRLIDEGHLGRVYYVRSYGHRRRGRPFVDGYGTANFVDRKISAGGALFDMGIYHLAQILHVISNPAVLTVTGTTHQELDMYEDRRQFSNYSVEELALGWVRFEGGVSFDIEEAWAVHYGGDESSKVLGSKGGLKLNPLTFFSNIADMPANSTFDLQGADTRWHACFPDTAWLDSSQRHWVGALLGRVPLLPTAEYALNAALISEGIYMSSELKREVTADEIRAKSKSTAVDPTTPEKVWG